VVDLVVEVEERLVVLVVEPPLRRRQARLVRRVVDVLLELRDLLVEGELRRVPLDSSPLQRLDESVRHLGDFLGAGRELPCRLVERHALHDGNSFSVRLRSRAWRG